MGCGNTTVNGNVLLNDSDFEGDSLSAATITNPATGDLAFSNNGDFTFTNSDSFIGIVTFFYRVCEEDNNQFCDEAEVVIIIKLDTDCDGIPNDDDIDDDDDGILDIHEGDRMVDSDEDGIPDSLDIDSDNDGITDNEEWQTEGNYISPSGNDTDGDGWDDAYDIDSGGTYYQQEDTDSDGIPDYLDLDTDGDGVPDSTEGHDSNDDGYPDVVPVFQDDDDDGLDNVYDIIDGWIYPDNPVGSNAPLQDTDEDGIRDWRDVDDDNDDKPTTNEDNHSDGNYAGDDEDNDGIPDYLDPYLDCELFIPNGFSPNDDGIHDFFEIYCMHPYPDADIEIYNRWGNLIFSKSNYGNTSRWGEIEAWWDGRSTHKWTVGDQKVPRGTYFYILDLNDGSNPRTGSVFVTW